MAVLYRSSFELASEGRTLSGLCLPWDTPTKVRDLTGPAYLEEFTPSSTDVTIRQNPNFPVFVRHKHDTDPIGVVTFRRSGEGLVYEAPLANTARADEMLELVNIGAIRAVSVGFRSIQHKFRATPLGQVTSRTEVGLLELSLAPTGMGQYPQALVSSVRTDTDETPALDALRRRRALLVCS